MYRLSRNMIVMYEITDELLYYKSFLSFSVSRYFYCYACWLTCIYRSCRHDLFLFILCKSKYFNFMKNFEDQIWQAKTWFSNCNILHEFKLANEMTEATRNTQVTFGDDASKEQHEETAWFNIGYTVLKDASQLSNFIDEFLKESLSWIQR